jgi:hypothetical protein
LAKDGGVIPVDPLTCEFVAAKLRNHHNIKADFPPCRWQGATTIWNKGGKKHTLEGQAGSLFSPPLNAWHQHFNVHGKKPTRMVCLTDAPVVINRYRNLDFIFNNAFVFSDTYRGYGDECSTDGHYLEGVKRSQAWESNFSAKIWVKAHPHLTLSLKGG